MKEALIHLSRRALGLRNLAGPIFDKELRVSSRHRRNYALRFVYLAALTILVALMWATVVSKSAGSSAYSASRMSEAGKSIVLCIVWFQFVAVQLIAVVLLSTAIGDEIVHRTLGVLMTTPITSFQIVLGKLLSKMLQLVGLLAISLPLLAVVRVFGGVPWDFVLAGLSLTLTSALGAASVSMFFSIRNRRAYVVILKTFGVGGIVYALLPFLGVLVIEKMDLVNSVSEYEGYLTAFLYGNPFGGLYYLTRELMEPGSSRSLVFYSWPLACAVALGVSLLLLAIITATVRKVALRQATGEAGTFGSRRKLRKAGASPAPRREGRIRRVWGCGVAWKEFRAPLIRGKTKLIAGIVVVLGILLVTYGLLGSDLEDRDVHIAYGVVFVILGILCTAILSATAITTEKEAQSWPILLLTPLSDWQILTGKAIGVFRRALPVWLLLFGHVGLFAFARYIHWAALPHLAMVTAWAVFFLTCSGLYFSARYKRTTTAVMMNLGLCVALWIAVPFVSVMVEELGSGSPRFSEWLVSGNPVVQVIVVVGVMSKYGGGYGTRWGTVRLSELSYEWPDGQQGFAQTTVIILFWCLAYLIAGLVLAGLARRRLRQKVF